jgi:very-short-patch-repair endonuclease
MNKTGCIICSTFVPVEVFKYSMNQFGVPVCRDHQEFIRNSSATPESFQLFVALVERGVPAQIEKDDGYKTIDIAIPSKKINIEVDGLQHSFKAKQALADLKRAYYSFKKGYLTLRIPNILVRQHLDETADYLKSFLNEI